MVGCHSILASISAGETAKIAHVYIGTYDGQLTADSENRDSQQCSPFKKTLLPPKVYLGALPLESLVIYFR